MDLKRVNNMPKDFADSVLYRADVEREQQDRANGVNQEDYLLLDRMREELRTELGVESTCFQDLRYRTIQDDACVAILTKYIPQFQHIGFAQELITQQFWRKGNKECSDFLQQWYVQLKAEGRLNASVENTLDNAFIKIQDKGKIPFYLECIKETNAFPFTMVMLGRWNVKESLPVILHRLQTDTIPTLAIRALAWYYDDSLISVIRPFLNHEKTGVVQAAKKAIERIEKSGEKKNGI